MVLENCKVEEIAKYLTTIETESMGLLDGGADANKDIAQLLLDHRQKIYEVAS